jgi:AcrR family transcriptional regulator
MNEADPRVKRTRKLLEEAFVALLAEKSFHTISVQDIAERATINRATFYAHFEDKNALLDQMIRGAFREALGRRVPADAPFTLGNLHLLVVAVCEFLGQFHGHCAPSGPHLAPPIEAKVQQELSAFLLAWLPYTPPVESPQGVRRETAVSVMSWAIFSAGIEWSRGKRTFSADQWARQILAVVVGGVSQAFSVPSQPPQRAPLRALRG